LRRYGLVLRPDFTVVDLAWTFNALQAHETWERLRGLDTPARKALDGARWSLTALTAIAALAGSVTDADGRTLTPLELALRRPVAAA
jgi:hypothetical protein